MKKMIKTVTIILNAIILCIIVCIYVIADSSNTFDCRDVSEEIRTTICTDGEDTIKYYNGTYMQGFASGESIDKLMDNTYVLETTVATYTSKQNSGVISRYTLRSGTPTILSDGTAYDGAQFFIDYTSNEMINKIQKKIHAKIENIICLSGANSNDGIYICYITENGNYVLFEEYEGSECQYLFPMSEFTSFAGEYLEERMSKLYSASGEVKKGASFSFSDVSGVDKYEVNFESIGVVISISCFAVAALMISVAVICITKRKNVKTAVKQ